MLVRNPPYLVVDVSAHYASPNWPALFAHPNVVGVILKATEGTTYAPQWFVDNWRRLRELAGGRYGNDFFRSAYHFMRRGDGAAQADTFCDHIIKAGGWDSGCMMDSLDIESAGVAGADADEIIETAHAFAKRYKERSGGRRLMVYARGTMRDLEIVDRLGCDAVWDAAYTKRIVTNGIAPFSLDDVVLWQYRGMNGHGEIEGDNSVHGLPMTIDGFDGAADFSVFVDGNRKPTLESFRRRAAGSLLATLLIALLIGLAAVASRHFA